MSARVATEQTPVNLWWEARFAFDWATERQGVGRKREVGSDVDGWVIRNVHEEEEQRREISMLTIGLAGKMCRYVPRTDEVFMKSHGC